MPHGAVVLSSQLAILAEGRAGTSLPVGQLPRGFLLDRMRSTVSDDGRVTLKVFEKGERRKFEQRAKEVLLLTAGTAASSRRDLFCGRLPI